MNTTQQHNNIFANRVSNVPQSFIREILKVTSNPNMVSFAGGLPNPSLFPVKEFEQCTASVFKKYGMQALQYAATEGLLPLREFIANRYKQRFDLDISPNQILITNGSQQALDLISKLFISPGDEILIERPGYLGAIQCFSMFEAKMLEVTLNEDGINTVELEEALMNNNIKLFYGIPNFQNPTGISYTEEIRKRTASILARYGTILVEDDPYGEIAFTNEIAKPIYSYIPDQTILLGSFSKIVAPGLRLGWMVANPDIIKKATILKQASDLHSGNLSQYILHQFLDTYDLDKHINKIRTQYQQQRNAMLEGLHYHFPFGVKFTRPQGGMFCWLELPEGISARELLQKAIAENILFVPGDTFYASNPNNRTLRLNFSNIEEEKIDQALMKLGSLI